MLRIRRILIPHDYSPFSAYAVRYGLDLARSTGATAHLLFAEVLYGDEAPRPGDTVFEVMAERVGFTLNDDDTLTYRGATIPVRQAVVRDVAAAPAIVLYAEEQGIDLVVMGTHGRRGLSRMLLGSVAAEVVRTAGCPVLTVRRPDEDAVQPPAARSILVPVDFSKHAREALRHAKAVAALTGARVHLLHIVEDRFHPAFYGLAAQSVYDIDPRIDEKALAELRTLDAEVEEPDVEVDVHVRTGHPARMIVDFAEEEGCDLIVMSTHGLRGMELFFLGSTAEKVIRRAPVPVLTVKAFGSSLLKDAASSVAEPLATP